RLPRRVGEVLRGVGRPLVVRWSLIDRRRALEHRALAHPVFAHDGHDGKRQTELLSGPPAHTLDLQPLQPLAPSCPGFPLIRQLSQLSTDPHRVTSGSVVAVKDATGHGMWRGSLEITSPEATLFAISRGTNLAQCRDSV